MRAAIYTRYSSELQSPRTCEDQITECKKHIDSKGWSIADGHIYSDRAVTGTDDRRSGYLAMREAARNREFDVLVVDDQSRLGRHHLEVMTAIEELLGLGRRFVAVSDGLDTSNKAAKPAYMLKSVMSELFLDDLRERVSRGLRGQVQRGYSTGGRVYGYQTVEDMDPTGTKDRSGKTRRLGVRVEVDPIQAETILKVFRLRSKGLGLKAIAGQLNNEGIPSPRFALRGTGERTWTPSSILYILGQRKYIGDWGWCRTQWRKMPGTGKRIKSQRPREEWIENPREDLRIVPDSLWAEAEQAGLANRSKRGWDAGKLRGEQTGKNDGKYLFSGVLTCATCGGKLIVISSGSYSSFVCARHWQRGNVSCDNDVRMPRRIVEDVLLTEIRRNLLSPKLVLALVERLRKKLESLSIETRTNRLTDAKIEQLREEVENLTRFVMGGDTSPSIRKALAEKENELRGLQGTGGTATGSYAWIVQQLTPERVLARLRAIETVLTADPARVTLARAELKSLVEGSICVKPIGKGRKGYYTAFVKGKPLNVLRGTGLSVNIGSATGIRKITDRMIEFEVELRKVA